MALQEIEDGICGCGCGQPIEEAWSEDGPEYRVETVTCRARAALDAEKSDPEPGEMRYVVPDIATDDDLAAERLAEEQALSMLRSRMEATE